MRTRRKTLGRLFRILILLALSGFWMGVPTPPRPPGVPGCHGPRPPRPPMPLHQSSDAPLPR